MINRFISDLLFIKVLILSVRNLYIAFISKATFIYWLEQEEIQWDFYAVQDVSEAQALVDNEVFWVIFKHCKFTQ